MVLVFFGGAGLILYGACWLLVPEDGDDHATINLDDRTRSVVLIVVGAVAALALIGDSWGAFWFPWPLADRRADRPVAADPQQELRRAGRLRRPDVHPRAADLRDTRLHATRLLGGRLGAAPGPAQHAPYAAAPPTAPYYPPQPPYVAPPVSYKVPNPRKRGPILFWFTLALIALERGPAGDRRPGRRRRRRRRRTRLSRSPSAA